MPALSSIIQPTFPTSPAPPRKWNRIPFSGGSSGYDEEEPGVYRTMSFTTGPWDMKKTLPPTPLLPLQYLEMDFEFHFVLVNHYSSKAEDLLLATEVNKILSRIIYFRLGQHCSSGTQGVGGNIEVRLNVAGAWAGRRDFCLKSMRIGVLAALHVWHCAP